MKKKPHPKDLKAAVAVILLSPIATLAVIAVWQTYIMALLLTIILFIFISKPDNKIAIDFLYAALFYVSVFISYIGVDYFWDMILGTAAFEFTKANNDFALSLAGFHAIAAIAVIAVKKFWRV